MCDSKQHNKINKPVSNNNSITQWKVWVELKFNYFVEYIEIQNGINVLLEMSNLLLKEAIMSQYIQESG